MIFSTDYHIVLRIAYSPFHQKKQRKTTAVNHHQQTNSSKKKQLKLLFLRIIEPLKQAGLSAYWILISRTGGSLQTFHGKDRKKRLSRLKLSSGRETTHTKTASTYAKMISADG